MPCRFVSCATAESRYRFEFTGILQLQLEVQFGIGRAPGLAHVPDHLSPSHVLARQHRDRRKMLIPPHHFVSVIQNQCASVPCADRRAAPFAVGSCAHRRALRHFNVDAELVASPDGRLAYRPIYGICSVGKPGTDGSTMTVTDIALQKASIPSLFPPVGPNCPFFGPQDGLPSASTELDHAITRIYLEVR
jgi:hypothetical protein